MDFLIEKRKGVDLNMKNNWTDEKNKGQILNYDISNRIFEN